MAKEERARQFLPFASLRGYEEMLKAVENAQNREPYEDVETEFDDYFICIEDDDFGDF